VDLRRRYLNLLKASLLNELYVENDVRLLHIGLCLKAGQMPSEVRIANPDVHLSDLITQVQEIKRLGESWWYGVAPDQGGGMLDARNYCDTAHSMIGAFRIDNIDYCLERILQDNVPGDLIETGVCRGGAVIYMRGYLEAFEMSGRNVWCADSFEGLPKPTHPVDHGHDFSADRYPILSVSQEFVEELFRRYGLLDDSVKFLKGWFKDTLPTAPIERLALLRLDGDLYESTMDALVALYHKISPGGFIIVDDYGTFEPCRRAIHEFRQQHSITEEMVRIDNSSVFWRKSMPRRVVIPR
jgi:O-methyltransferase